MQMSPPELVSQEMLERVTNELERNWYEACHYVGPLDTLILDCHVPPAAAQHDPQFDLRPLFGSVAFDPLNEAIGRYPVDLAGFWDMLRNWPSSDYSPRFHGELFGIPTTVNVYLDTKSKEFNLTVLRDDVLPNARQDPMKFKADVARWCNATAALGVACGGRAVVLECLGLGDPPNIWRRPGERLVWSHRKDWGWHSSAQS